MRRTIFLGILFSFLAAVSTQAQDPNNQASQSQPQEQEKKQIVGRIKFKQYKNFSIYRKEGRILVKYKSADDRNAARLKLTQEYIKRIKPIGERLSQVSFDEKSIQFSDFASALMKDLTVEAVEPDLFMNSLAHRDLTPKQWPIQMIKKSLKKQNQREWIKLSAKSHRVRVGILDTGLDYTHPDLIDNTFRGINLIYDGPEMTPAKNSGEEADDPSEMDYNGHGTMIAGVIGAMHNDFGVDGLDPQPLMCGIKVFDEDGVGYLSDIIQGIYWAIENKIEILNMSFGTYEYSQFLEEAILEASTSGMISSGAAGNDYANEAMYPAKFEQVIAVGNYDAGSWLNRFSNWGEDVDFYVPGSELPTTQSQLLAKEDPYNFFTGTSAAASYMTGILSLLKSQGFTLDQIETLLKHNTIKYISEQNPVMDPFDVLNSTAIIAEVNKEKFSGLSLVKFFKDKRVIKKGEKVNITYAIQNTGLVKTKKQGIYFQAKTSKSEKKVLMGELPVLKPGEIYEGLFTVVPENLFTEAGSFDFKFTKINLNVAVESNEMRTLNNNLAIFVTEEVLPKAVAQAIWVSPMDMNEQIEGRKIFVKVQNIGNQALGNLSLKISYVNATHEGVTLAEEHVLIDNYAVGNLGIYESRTIEMDISEFIPPLREVTFIAKLIANDKVMGAYKQEYLYNSHGQAWIQYATVVHRDIVVQAVNLLREKGVYIEDLMGPNALTYFGDTDIMNPNTKTHWPFFLDGLLGDLPTSYWRVDNQWMYYTTYYTDPEYLNKTEMNTSGFWTDEVLDLGDAYWGSKGYDIVSYSAIAGSTDCDFIDIVFGKTEFRFWDSHFWMVDESDDCGRGGCDGVSAYRKVDKLLNGGSDLLHGAIEHYNNGHKRAAWWFLGHALHLIGDISVPSHVNDPNNHGVVGCPYHNWMDRGEWDDWNFDLAKNQGFLDPFHPENEGNPIKFLTYTTAQVGNAWPWACTRQLECWLDQSSDGKEGNRSLGRNASYVNYMQGIFSSLPPRPVKMEHIDKNEVNDYCTVLSWPCFVCPCPWGECQLVDWVNPAGGEFREDCMDGGDGVVDYDNTNDDGVNDDGDLSRIRDHSYTYAVRAAAGLIYYFSHETGKLVERVSDRVIDGTETITARQTLLLQNVTVKAPNGNATFKAGEKIKAIPPVHVERGSKAQFKIDPSLKGR